MLPLIQHPRPELRERDVAQVEGAGTQTEISRVRAQWKRDRLSLIRSQLRDAPLDELKRLENELGEADHPDFTAYSEGWIGPTSPLSTTDLQEMTADQLLEYLTTWEPEAAFDRPSPEGLGRSFAVAIQNQPEEFASRADGFLALDPTYVRFLLSGLTEAVKAGAAVTWGPVLQTCRRIVEDPPTVKQPRGRDSDPDWGWTRRQITDLLSAGFESSDSGLTIDERDEAWSVIAVLAEDANPTPSDEEKYGGDNMDPATYSINTTRGSAMHAVIRYAAWVHMNADEGGATSLPVEVKAVLDGHLRKEQEPSLAIRAVYGMRFKQLVALDPTWAREAASRIFPVDPAENEIFVAAWNAYVIYNNPWGEVLEFAADAYGRAVELLASPPQGRHLGGDPRQRLGEHLLMLYWWGRIDARPEGLLGQLWMTASDALRGRLVQFVGRAVGAEPADPLPDDVQSRLRDLWARILEQEINPETPDAREEVLAPFGWWYTAGAFDDDWALDQLIRIAEQGVTPDPINQVMERIPGADASLQKQLAAVKAIAQTRMRPYLPESAIGALTELFSRARDTDDEQTRSNAADAVDALVARGLMAFRDRLGARSSIPSRPRSTAC